VAGNNYWPIKRRSERHAYAPIRSAAFDVLFMPPAVSQTVLFRPFPVVKLRGGLD
jgi:hypothetical protein